MKKKQLMTSHEVFHFLLPLLTDRGHQSLSFGKNSEQRGAQRTWRALCV